MEIQYSINSCLKIIDLLFLYLIIQNDPLNAEQKMLGQDMVSDLHYNEGLNLKI